MNCTYVVIIAQVSDLGLEVTKIVIQCLGESVIPTRAPYVLFRPGRNKILADVRRRQL